MKQPLLSICIPTYNRARSVERCVRHILSYEGDDIEVAVSINPAPDNTAKTLATMDDPRLSVRSNDSNIGMAANFVAALRMGKGRFSLLISDEDLIHIDQIDKALAFLKTVNPDCAAVRFGRDGILRSVKELFHAPAGPETFVFSVLNCGDVAGTAYNRKILDTVDMKRYVDVHTGFYGGFSVIDILLEPSKQYSACFCPVVLVNRRYDDESFDGAVATVDDAGEHGYELCSFAPEGAFAVFRILNGIAEKLYGEDKRIDGLRTWMIKFCAAHMVLVPSISLYLHDGDWTDLKYRNGKSEKAFFEKWGAPWELVNAVTEKCIGHLAERTEGETWRNVMKLFALFRENRLDEPVADYSRKEKCIAGDLMCMTGVDCTGHGYFPENAPAFDSAEFPETAEVFRLFSAGEYEKVVAFPALDTRRDYFFRGAAHMRLGNHGDAETCFLEHVDRFEQGKTVGDILIAQQTLAQSYYFLGRLLQRRGNHAAACANFAACHRLIERCILQSYFTEARMKRLGLPEDCERPPQ